MLFRDEATADSDDLDEYTVIVAVEADSREEAWRKVKRIAVGSGLEEQAFHDGWATYVIVRTRDQLQATARQVKVGHNRREQACADSMNARGGDGKGNPVVPRLVPVD
jgi:hypothetical protein